MTKQCVQCGKSFQARSRVHAFCSQRCSRAARGSNWRTIRTLRLMLDGQTCRQCGATDCRLEVHHIVFLCLGGTSTLENLTSLCHLCHRHIHREWRKKGNVTNTGQDTHRATPGAKAA